MRLGDFLVKLTFLIVVLMVSSAAIGQEFQIVRAEYGADRRWVDVTGQLRQIAATNTTFRMGNSTFGIDPAPGVVKTLRILARGRRGKERTFEYREGSTVDGSIFSGWRGGQWGGNPSGGDSGQYQIQRAEYGADRRWIDVTRDLQRLAASDAVFRMGNSTFGTDPAPGVVKTLRIFAWGPGGDNRVFEYREGSTVDGSIFTGWKGGNWGGDRGQYVIRRAEYGADNRWVDVTQRLRQLAANDATFRMGNSTFGVDPAPGTVKMLRIYTRGPQGGNRVFEYREGSTVDGSWFSGWRGGRWNAD